MRRTLYTHCLTRVALPVDTHTATANGTTVDLGQFGNDFRTVLFVIAAGTVTDGTYAFTMQDSDNGSDWTAVDATRVQGSLPTLDDGDSDTVAEVGYIVGTQRYVRLVMTEDSATTGAVVGAVAVLGAASSSPVARA
jgi:hypothetical protein